MILGIIPARKGSSLKGKNYYPLCGKPLYMWTVEAAIESDLVDQWIISTNDPNIQYKTTTEKDIYFFYNQFIRIVHIYTDIRPDNLCQDDSPIEEALRFHVQKFENLWKHKIDYIVMCLPNVPVRKPGMIDRCINHLQEHSDLDSVISVTTPRHHPFWMKKDTRLLNLKDERMVDILKPFIEQIKQIYRRQDLLPVYIGDGAVHVVRRDVLMNAPVGTQHGWLGENIGFIWQEEEYGIEIDSKLDLLLAEAVLKEQMKK